MAQKIILVCKYGALTRSLFCYSDFDFGALFDKVREKFSIPIHEKVRLSYSMPNHEVCVLNDREDLEVLFQLSHIFGLSFVNVSVESSLFSMNSFTVPSECGVNGSGSVNPRYTELQKETERQLKDTERQLSHIGCSDSTERQFVASTERQLSHIGRSDSTERQLSRTERQFASTERQLSRSERQFASTERLDKVPMFVEQTLPDVHCIEAAYDTDDTDDEPNDTVFFIDGEASSSGANKSQVSCNWSDLIQSVGQVFVGGVEHFRMSLAMYATGIGFKYQFVRNERERVKAVCSLKDLGCDWFIKGSRCSSNSYFFIRKLNNIHTCGQLLFAGQGLKFLKSKWLARAVADLVRLNPRFGPNDVANHLQSMYGLHLSYKKCYCVLVKAKNMIGDTSDDSFSKLRPYVDSLLSTNPGSHITLSIEEDGNRFQSLFVSFHASIVGFNHCRPLLFLDGTFLKGDFKGVILAATGKDGNQGLFSLAFAVVSRESRNTWHWFLSELRKVLPLGRQINFVSDRNLGLVEALPEVFPTDHYSYCLRHLKDNLKAKFRNTSMPQSYKDHLITLFDRCAHAPSQLEFYECLREFQEKGGVVATKFLECLPFERWAVSIGGGCCYGEMTTNAAESFNAWILGERSLPITQLVDRIRTKLMAWFQKRSNDSMKWNGVLCPNMLERLNILVANGRSISINRSSEHVFEVMTSPSASVDIKTRCCSCLMWQINGFPCLHAACVLRKFSIPVEEMVDAYFLITSYKKSYEECINPVPSSIIDRNARSTESYLAPPTQNRLPGRPKKKRIKSGGEVARTMRCSRCKKYGHHNKKTCKEAI